MSGKQTVERYAVVALLLALAVLAVYLPVLRFDFINYDDPAYITGNLHIIGGLTWEGFAWGFTHSCVANWHPITWISHMLDCQIYGVSPAGHHLTNVILHALNSILLFLFLRDLSGEFWRSTLVAACFALHPMHVESVAWIAERKDVLGAFFGILSLWAYVRYTKASGQQQQTQASAPLAGLSQSALARSLAGSPAVYYLLSLVLFALALMSKAMLVTLPFVMLLLDFWPLRRADFSPQQATKESHAPNRLWLNRESLQRFWELLFEKLPFFALSAICSVITILVVQAAGGVASSAQVPIGLRLANLPVNYIRYLAKVVWPTKLAIVYPLVRQWPLPVVLVCAVLVSGLVVLVVFQGRRRPFLLIGLFWFLGMLVPVVGIVQAGSQSIADRFTYLPTIGLFIAIVWGVAEVTGKTGKGKIFSASAAGALLIVYTLLAQGQALYWQNSDTVFRHAVKVTRDNFVAYRCLGLDYAAYREHEDARRCYRAALAIEPNDQLSWNGLAMALINQRKYEEAVRACEAALQLDPNMAMAHATLGLALGKLGSTNEALAQYEAALRADPDLPDAHYNLGNALATAGKLEGACQHYAAAVRLNPGWADAHNNLAYMLSRQGKWEAAAAEFRSALILQPDLWQARYGLAEALQRQNKTRDAVEEYRQVLQTKPALVEALNRLAWILATDANPDVRRGPEAVALAQRACQLTQNRQPVVLSTLAAAYAELGRFQDAVETANLAVQISRSAGRSDLAQRTEMLAQEFRAGHAYHEGPAAIPQQ